LNKYLDLTIIGAIENSKDRFVEKEYLLMARSLRRNGGIYKNCPMVLLQPTDKNISPRTMIELKKLGVDFIKSEKPLLTETGRGFLNMPFTCAYLSKFIKTEYMLWLDCDTLVLKEPMFQELNNNEVAVHINMTKYDRFFNDQHKADYFEDVEAQAYLCKLLTREENLLHVNTWLIQAKTNSTFWSDWCDDSMRLVEKVKVSKNEIIESKFMTFSGQGTKHPILDYALSSVEEISAGLLAKKYHYLGPLHTAHQYIDENTFICHYDDWNVLNQIYPSKETLEDIEVITKICR
jgi:hypothetical protein